MKNFICLLLLLIFIGGCSTMLPKSHTESTSFTSFDEARLAIEKLEPMKSDKGTLERNGFNPVSHPNTKILTHTDVVRLFVPTTLLRREDLDPGVLMCLEARDACHGLEITGSKIARVRTGNFLADFSNFKRRTETSGWRFNGLILFVKDTVVYRSWSGQPSISEVEITHNPLGPLQDVGPSLLSVK